MASRLEVRDPIHGFIYRNSEERDIIDTPLYQRLRNLYQLAMARLVYPGATHTRFDHSLGAFHLAAGLSRFLVEDETERRLVRLAALLHDIGHGPFSHVSEPILKQYSDKSKLKAAKSDEQIHELISAQIIMNHPDLDRHLSDSQREHIVGLIQGTWGHRYLHEIVSGPVDADKQDYLLRDSHFTGVKYGIYDQERLKNTLRRHDDNDDLVLAISIDGLHSLEQFVLAKYYMTTQVYRHRIRLITDKMIERGIELGIREDKLDWLRSVYAYDETLEFVKHYLEWYDERLSIEILRAPDGYARDMFERLRQRKLFKCIFEADQNDFPDPHVRSFVFTGEKTFFKPLESATAKQFGFDENHVIAYRIEFSSAAETESEIPVLHRTKTSMFLDESALFKSVDQKIREQHLHVYAPVDYAGDEKQKSKRLNEFKEFILKTLQELAPQQPLPLD